MSKTPPTPMRIVVESSGTEYDLSVSTDFKDCRLPSVFASSEKLDRLLKVKPSAIS